jgi:hypothetical protein
MKYVRANRTNKAKRAERGWQDRPCQRVYVQGARPGSLRTSVQLISSHISSAPRGHTLAILASIWLVWLPAPDKVLLQCGRCQTLAKRLHRVLGRSRVAYPFERVNGLCLSHVNFATPSQPHRLLGCPYFTTA